LMWSSEIAESVGNREGKRRGSIASLPVRWQSSQGVGNSSGKKEECFVASRD
jgi:hypothetical protein